MSSWPPWDSFPELPKHKCLPAHLPPVGIFVPPPTPRFKSQICWLVVPTHSTTELWVKCASVLPLAVRDPPQPAPGPAASSRRKETPERLHAWGHVSPQP